MKEFITRQEYKTAKEIWRCGDDDAINTEAKKRHRIMHDGMRYKVQGLCYKKFLFWHWREWSDYGETEFMLHSNVWLCTYYDSEEEAKMELNHFVKKLIAEECGFKEVLP